MEHPDWFSGWRDEAVRELQDKNARLERDYGIGSGGRYDYDLDTSTLVFSSDNGARAVAEIQVLGTTSAAAGNWLWAWANPDWPEPLTADSLKVREFGDEHEICELTHDYVFPEDGVTLNGLGWELSAAAVRVCDAIGAYRPPRDEGGGLYLLMRSIAWAA